MNQISRKTTAALDRVQDRFLRSRLKISRRGSVLIIVVALLVLMAIIGTAYISTARTDRGAAASNAANTEVTLLLQGVEDMATSQLIADVNPYTTTQTINGAAATINATRFRTAGTPYTPYNSAYNDQWLADRVPVAFDSTVAATPASLTNPVVWRYVSLPPINLFSDPISGATYGGTGTSPGTSVNTRCDYMPSAYGSTTYPGLSVYYSNNGVGTWAGPYLAADTDGDGIADAGLFRLPVSEINGVTYFGAYRIVDNCAAVNTSTAWTQQGITPAAPTVVSAANASTQQKLPGNFFPTNVDLAALVPDSLANLNTYRFGAGSPNTTPTEGSYAFSYYPGYSATYPSGVGYNNYDAAWHELGRRLQNPASGYTALSAADSAAMAHRFVIRDPNASLSSLEQNLPNSTINTTYVPTQPYNASDITDWYGQNFNYAIGTQSNLSLRSMLVGLNPVSNFTQSKYGPLIAPNVTNNPTGAPLPGAAWTATLSTTYPNSNYSSYTFGDWVTYNNHAYVCIQPNNGQTPPTTVTADTNYFADSPFWVYEPWTNAPVKTSVNTATFGQLWLGYWNVMSDTQGNAPLPQALNTSNSTVSSTGAMFRSSLRSSTGTSGAASGAALSATQELQLRAAITATNTLALRSTNGTGQTQEVAPIYDYTQNPPVLEYNAVIAGNQPQPYITEVFADNDPAVGDGTNGYIAVELYNPYPYNIQLTGWALATVSRPNSPGAMITPTVIPSTSTGWDSSGPTIPANGYAVFANTGAAIPTDFSAGPVATTANATAPTAAKPPLYVVTDLNQAFDSDLVLMRPPPGTATASGTPVNVTGYFPVDSYDFTGLKAQIAAQFNPANTYEWHYARPNALPWEFVYPGPFDQTLGTDGSKPRFKCTQASASYTTLSLNSGSPPPLAAGSVATLGVADAAGTTGSGSFPAPGTLPPIQVDNIDFGGPSKLSTSTNYFPFGQFARNGDIMQAPFIGSYLLYRGAAIPANLVEMNPITLDSTYAASTGGDQTVSLAGNYLTQNIGRIAPYWGIGGDYSPNSNPHGISPYTTGQWELRLMDYLTIQAPSDDYLPNTDPIQYSSITGKIPLAVANLKSTIVNAVTTNAGSATEDTVPVHGLININTAPWRVLATLPFSDDPNTNAALAQAIVNYRDGFYFTQMTAPYPGHGPFQNVFELNNVQSQFNYTQTGLSYASVPSINFIQTLGSYNNAGSYPNAYIWNSPTRSPSNNDGMLTPLYATFSTSYPSATPYVPTTDFQTQHLALTRVSNLITTRSDSYTVYVQVQGWSNAGKPNAQMVVQRRAAFIVDRSGMTPANPTVTSTPVSTN